VLQNKNQSELFDLIVVYSENYAKSALDEKYRRKAPFPAEFNILNDSYSYMLTRCRKSGIKAALTTSKDITGPGTFKGFWTYDTEWARNKGRARCRLIFDKFAAATTEQAKRFRLLTSSPSILKFNEQKLTSLFRDKLKTYELFREFAIPSEGIKSLSERNIYLAKSRLDRKLRVHRHSGDFTDGYVIKDRAGASGMGIHRTGLANGLERAILEQRASDTKQKRMASYILQPFISCEKGFAFGEHRGLIDVRVILLDHRPLQTYIRIAKRGEFRCNEHQGGELVYISLKELPKDITESVKNISRRLSSVLNARHVLYALDFMRSNSGNLYLVEGNSKPGIDWNHRKRTNEIRTKELIDSIVKKLKLIINERKQSTKNPAESHG